MNIKIKKSLSFLLILIILLTNISPVFALSFTNGQVVTLQKDHECTSLLKFKGEDKLKAVTYIVYKNNETGKTQPAFCVEPNQEGIGTGAGDSYDVTLSKMTDQKFWRVLYKGYMGSNYTDWGLECNDDLYYATKTAIHCFCDGSTPIGKYEVPNRVGWGESVSLEDVQRRAAKVLDVAQELYDYGVNGSENYLEPKIYASKTGYFTGRNMNGIRYMVQTYSVTGNREIQSYQVSISNFPEGTKIMNDLYEEVSTLYNGTFRIAIPATNITGNSTGNIYITNAKVKTYPVFFAKAFDEEQQDYIIYADPTEEASTNTTQDINGYRSTLIIRKVDKNTSYPIQGVKFNVKYGDTNENIGDFTTNNSGLIIVDNLRKGKITITELSTLDQYELNTEPIDVDLDYAQTKQVNVQNSLKQGNIKVIKIDKDNEQIRIPNVEFKLLDSNKNQVGTYTTNENGEINIENLKIGTYTLQETLPNPAYYPLDHDLTINVEQNKTTEVKVTNEKMKGQIKITKVDKEFPEIKLENAEFEIIDTNDKIVEKIKTDQNGEAITTLLPIGTYRIKEVATGNDNYILDEQNIRVEVENEKITEQVIQNIHKTGNIKVYKLDKDNNKITLGNVKFDLFSEEFNKVIGTFTTDANGEINIQNIRIGDYKLIEKETNQWYDLTEDTNIKVEWDTTINTIIENELKKGQIKVIKVDRENTEIRVPGITFAVLDKQGNILEKITTDENGEAITKKYSVRDYETLTLKEIETNSDYALNKNPQTITLEAHQIKTITFENDPAEIKVNVEKTGFSEVECNQNIYYDFKNIQNNSNVSLENFIWSDQIPVEAVRVEKIQTGTWNEDLKYSVWYKTNKNDFKIIAEGLSTQQNNEINFNNLELEEDEYITEYEFRFGKVKSGFSEVEKPRLYCNVIDNLENGFKFINNTKVTGNYKDKKAEAEDYWITLIYNKQPEPEKLPRTGF